MKKLVIFSGAGLSAESGIPTFRGTDGLWENHRIEDVASPEGFNKDPELVLNFYKERFKTISSAEPNDAHKAIADMQEDYEVINFTQNIDNLLERAGCTDVRHMHGSIFRKKCGLHKDLAKTHSCDYIDECDEPLETTDKCPKCNGQLRPDIVWFGEAVQYDFKEIIELCKEVKYNDGVFICVGTTGNVQPAGSVISFFSQVKNKYIVDLNPRKIADYKLIPGLATEGMKMLQKKLKEENQS